MFQRGEDSMTPEQEQLDRLTREHLIAETTKLRLESLQLRRPWKAAHFWVGLLPTVLALGTLIFAAQQGLFEVRSEKLANDEARLRLEIAQHRDELARLEQAEKLRDAAELARNAALAQQQQAIVERDAATTSKALLEKQQATLIGEVATLQSQAQASRTERDSAVASRDAAEKQRDMLNEEVGSLRGEREALAREKSELVQERDTIRGERDGLANERDKLTAQNTQLSSSVEALRAQRSPTMTAKILEERAAKSHLDVSVSGPEAASMIAYLRDDPDGKIATELRESARVSDDPAYKSVVLFTLAKASGSVDDANAALEHVHAAIASSKKRDADRALWPYRGLPSSASMDGADFDARLRKTLWTAAATLDIENEATDPVFNILGTLLPLRNFELVNTRASDCAALIQKCMQRIASTPKLGYPLGAFHLLERLAPQAHAILCAELLASDWTLSPQEVAWLTAFARGSMLDRKRLDAPTDSARDAWRAWLREHATVVAFWKEPGLVQFTDNAAARRRELGRWLDYIGTTDYTRVFGTPPTDS